jgi:hypothetical protein
MSGGSQWQREVDALKPRKKGKAAKSTGFAGCSCGAMERVWHEPTGVEVECSKCGARALLAIAIADEVM